MLDLLQARQGDGGGAAKPQCPPGFGHELRVPGVTAIDLYKQGTPFGVRGVKQEHSGFLRARLGQRADRYTEVEKALPDLGQAGAPATRAEHDMDCDGGAGTAQEPEYHPAGSSHRKNGGRDGANRNEPPSESPERSRDVRGNGYRRRYCERHAGRHRVRRRTDGYGGVKKRTGRAAYSRSHHNDRYSRADQSQDSGRARCLSWSVAPMRRPGTPPIRS